MVPIFGHIFLLFFPPDSYALDTRMLLPFQFKGLFHDALTNYDLAILIYENDADAFFQRANAYAGLNENGMASEDLQSGIKLNPKNVAAIRRRATMEFRLGHFPVAISLFSNVIEVRKRETLCNCLN